MSETTSYYFTSYPSTINLQQYFYNIHASFLDLFLLRTRGASDPWNLLAPENIYALFTTLLIFQLTLCNHRTSYSYWSHYSHPNY